MKTIWKYELRIEDIQKLEMPKESKILSVQMQHSTPCIWIQCDNSNDMETRNFHTFGTGNPLPNDIDNFTYIGTYQINSGVIIFHVFES